jgi:hypothetical protein
MNLNLTTAEITSLISSAVSLLSSIYLLLFKFAQMEVKVDTLWLFQLRRGEAEALRHGFATKNSPISVIDNRARDAFPPDLANALHGYFARQGRHLTRVEMAAEIERRFGPRIVDEVCIPQGISNGTCLILAMHFAATG